MRSLILLLLLMCFAPHANAQNCSFANPAACGSPGVNNLAVGGTINGGTLSGTVTGAGVSTATGGNTSRSNANHFGDVVNIKDLGAACDGVTNDTNAFTTAFGLASGTTVLIPKDVTCIISAQQYSAGARAVSFIGANQNTSKIKIANSSSLTPAQLFLWNGATNLTIKNLTLDLNSMAPTNAGVSAIFNTISATGLTVEHVSVINAVAGTNGGVYIFACNSCTNFNYDHNYVQFTAGSSTIQTKAIATLRSFNEVVGGRITNNVLVNTNTNITGSHIYVAGNDVSGWGIGAGLAIGGTDVGSFENIVTGNFVHDSLLPQDPFSEYPNCYEIWGPKTVVTNNIATTCSGVGFAIGSKNGIVVGNLAKNNGQGTTGQSGFSGAYTSATYNASGAYFDGNTAFDDGTGTQAYGYEDCCANISGVIIGSNNNFSGATAPYLFRSTTGLQVGGQQFINEQTLTVGTSTWTVPSVQMIQVSMCGGGGAGGSVASGGGNAAAASGVPGQCVSFFAQVTPGASMAYTVGAGGSSASAGNNPGGNGGSTTFDGVTISGGGGGNGSATGNAAAVSLNTINTFPGTAPSASLSITSLQSNVNIGGSTSTGGNGVGTWYSPKATAVSNSAGTDATGNGGSGSGAGTTGASSFAGGKGADGVIVIRW